jgi:hypothetical protein
MDNSRDQDTNRRWQTVSAATWGPMSLLLFLRGLYFNFITLRHPEPVFAFVVSLIAAVILGGLFSLCISLPFRVYLNLTQPERRKARCWETAACICAFSALAWMVTSIYINYPRGW